MAQSRWACCCCSSATAATKRETYLLPLLPRCPHGSGYGSMRGSGNGAPRRCAPPGWRWWLRYALLALYALAPPVALMATGAARMRRPRCCSRSRPASRCWRRTARGWLRAGRAALGCAWMGTAALLLLLPRAVDAAMAPFVRWMGQQLPADGTVYALSNVAARRSRASCRSR
ncbi:MAG: hypothetical protein U1F06_01110 [Steroidobacteraceae bacterium]